MAHKIIIRRVKNTHGIKVKRCCLSCQHMYYDDEGCRICQLMGILVGANLRCPAYQMSVTNRNAGIGWGRVKRQEYLEFVKNIRADEAEAIQMGRMKAKNRKTLLQIRQEFIEKYGSIYCIQ